MGRVRSVLVVVGAFLNMFLGNGFYNSIGLFIVEWHEEFGGTTEEIAWIGSFCLMGYALAGLSVLLFSSRISCRVIAMFGGALTSISLSSAVFANEIWHLLLLMFLAGFGLGCSRNGCLAIIGFHVTTHLGVAYGFVTSGSSFGLLTLSPIFTMLIDKYSWRGTMLITGALLGNQCVYGALFLETGSETKQNTVKSGAQVSPKPDQYCTNDEVQREKSRSKSFDRGHYTSIGGRRKSSVSIIKRRISRTSVQLANGIKQSHTVAIFKNIRLLCFSVAIFLRGFAFFAAMVHLVALCIDSGISKTDAAFLLSLLGICNATARLTHGVLIDKGLITPLHLISLTLIIGGLSCILVAILSTFATLVVFVIVFGITAGIYHALTTCALRDILDIHLVKGGLGLLGTVGSVGGLIGVPITGKLFDVTKNYSASCYLAGSLLIASGILHCMDHLLVGYQQRQSKKTTCEEIVDEHVMSERNRTVNVSSV